MRHLSLHLSAPSTLYDLRQKVFCFVSQTHPVVPSLIWSLCSSDRRFAARFLQISRHREHPCVKLTVTSVFTARDLHPIDYAHAGRTKRSLVSNYSLKTFPSVIWLLQQAKTNLKSLIQ